MGKLEQVLATFAASGIPFTAPLASVRHFTHQFLFFHRLGCPRDATRAGSLAAILLPACKAPTLAASFLSDALGSDDTAASLWSHRTSKLLAVSFLHLTEKLKQSNGSETSSGNVQSGGSVLTSQGEQSLLDLAEILTLPETWPSC